MERNIPDVRDIFGRTGADSGNGRHRQELRCYEYSPRSRRKNEVVEKYDSKNLNTGDNRPTKEKRISRQRTEDGPEQIRHKKASAVDDNTRSPKNSKDAAYYANKTLTERDIRHLERHLSMKKTIRKQISRNLAQAFVDDPDLVLNNEACNVPIPAKSNKVQQHDRSFTLTRAKVSKSEQNVLDLLKDNEPDSGHCSADNPNSSDDDSNQEQFKAHPVRQPEKLSRNVPDSVRCSREDGKFSFWKMFSVKNKGKR